MARRSYAWRALIGSLIASAAMAAGASAATITVDMTDDNGTITGDCELREAINAANANSAVDGCSAGQGQRPGT